MFITTTVSSCIKQEGTNKVTDNTILVEVNGKALYLEEVAESIPKGLSPTDSTLNAEAYIKMWIKDELMYEKASENITDKKKIDELVENYRQNLTIFTYQEQLLKQRLSKEISENELKDYYDKNSQNLDLQTDIIKGLFLKVPLTSTRLEDLKKWYKSTSESAIENIEKYSLENAVIYDLFYNNWVSFDDVLLNIPQVIPDKRIFLKENKQIEVEDSLYVYLLNIKDYKLAGDNAPFEFTKGQIMEILLNQRREDFTKQIEADLYDEALKQGKITFFDK
ncbi:peptidyl-prolyl cis-trans isomerase [Dysgonomonas sp. 216]|nr:peptidyl-prolyl cis-trans isomerase [Dysgonomonas sp. 216]NDW18684.1 peptidyl-prolyl cis-trans isomerase [Dysgonomonas sp. 216]